MLHPNEHVADPPVEAWRGVLTGLTFVRAAQITLFGSVVFIPLLIAVGSGQNIHHLFWILRAQGLYALVVAILFLIGASWCCMTSPDIHARRYAQATLVLTLTAAALAGTMIGLEFVILPNVSQDMFNRIGRIDFLTDLLGMMLALSAIMAIGCWHHYLATVAENFGQTKLADNTKGFSVWICTCGTGAAVVVWAGFRFGFEPLAALGTLVSALLALLVLIFTAALTFDVRKLIVRAMRTERVYEQPQCPTLD